MTIKYALMGPLCLILATLVLAAAPAHAQSLFSTTSHAADSATPALPDPLTEEAANALISRLSDAQVRGLLLDQLNAQAVEEGADDADVNDFFYHATTGAVATITEAIKRVPLMFSSQARAFSNFGNFLGVDGLLRLLGFFALATFGGLAVELAFRRIVRKWLVLPPVAPADQTLRQKLGALGARLTGNIVAVGVFIVAAYLITVYVVPQFYHPFIMLVGPFLIGLPRMAMAFVRFLMAPDNPTYRIVYTDDQTAKAMVFHNFWLVFLIGLSFVLLPFNAANGVPMGETRLGFWLNFAVHAYLVFVIWRYREGLVTMMRGADADVSPIEEQIARIYPIFAIVVSIGTWWVVNIVVSYGNFELLANAPHYKTMFLLFFAPAMDTTIRAIVRHAAPPMTGEGPIAERAHYAAKRSYIRVGRVVVFGIVLILIGRFWGMTPGSLASAGVGERLAANVLEFLMIISIGYVIYELVSLYINRKLAAEQTSAGYDPDTEDTGDGGGAGGSRLSTVLPLILGVSQAAIVVLFILLALSNIGVDTTPLLAGAGIVGLAIGFGAQKLVTDVVSGIFFLVDDAFRTGEYVEVDGTMGTVEKISIRSMQLRHHKGPVHTLPYGEIPKITNFSRDWVIMKLRFTVPFGTDPEKVRKLFKKIGQEMMALDQFKDDFLQPFKSQGVFEFDDVGIVIRGKFMAKPGTQFVLRKEIYNRVNKAFEENGLEFARREVRVALPGLEDGHKLTEDETKTVAAAATQAAQEMAADRAKPEKPGD
ncbi:mechanosensitive ion channel family protein [uncultured Tateyamaria sp.]|uniref:mechanosensitive ion channel family protein n=1 Tax=uncultured Tateyamaria sp. TaxID=455651 RepID=UPI00262D9D23|nr:mechanosensitive ion channel family protein [uncultured Tateyamaria sp.]